MMVLDLRPGQKVRIVEGHDHAKDGEVVRHNQVHGGGSKEGGFSGRRLCQTGPRPRMGLVTKYREDLMAVVVMVDKVEQFVGIWWLDAVSAGTVEYTPVVNASPKMSSRVGCRICK